MWQAAYKAVTQKPPRIIPRLKHQALPSINVQPLRPIDRMNAEMWEDYSIFKAAGLLKEWRRKWAAYLSS